MISLSLRESRLVNNRGSSWHLSSKKNAANLHICRAERRLPQIPDSPEETADQAIGATKAAFRDGIRYQRIEMLPPLIGATDLDDWPGGIQQMFTAIVPMVERLLLDVKSTEDLQCRLKSQILDEGDAVALWSGDNIKSILFPTADTLLKAKSMPPVDTKLFLLINPQWTRGQVISDFGFGRKRQEIETFLSTFEDTYCLKRYRMKGCEIRLLRAYPSGWCIFAVDGRGNSACIAEEKEKPTYRRIEQILVDAGRGGGNVLERLKREFDFNIKSLKQP